MVRDSSHILGGFVVVFFSGGGGETRITLSQFLMTFAASAFTEHKQESNEEGQKTGWSKTVKI